MAYWVSQLLEPAPSCDLMAKQLSEMSAMKFSMPAIRLEKKIS